MLRRGPYIIAAGLDDSIGGEPRVLDGHFINLFDSTLSVQKQITISPGSRYYLLDLDRVQDAAPRFLASACRVNVLEQNEKRLTAWVEGVTNTPAIVLIKADRRPKSIRLVREEVKDFSYSPDDRLLWIHFANDSRQRKLMVVF